MPLRASNTLASVPAASKTYGYLPLTTPERALVCSFAALQLCSFAVLQCSSTQLPRMVDRGEQNRTHRTSHSPARLLRSRLGKFATCCPRAIYCSRQYSNGLGGAGQRGTRCLLSSAHVKTFPNFLSPQAMAAISAVIGRFIGHHRPRAQPPEPSSPGAAAVRSQSPAQDIGQSQV